MFTSKPLPKEISKKFNNFFFKCDTEIFSTSDKKKSCVVNERYLEKYAEKIKNMKVYEDDVWVVSFMKCGTTWTQEMIWMLNNNLNYKIALKTDLAIRFPYLEFDGMIKIFYDSLKLVEDLSRPRHIKTHLPLFLLPDELWTVKPKIIYVTRNPKDAAVSGFHQYSNLQGFKGSMSEFVDLFLKDKIFYSPFNDHVLDFWKIRHQPNILFIFYEDMKRNLEGVVKEAMKFLDKNYTQSQIKDLCEHLSFESMRKNSKANNENLRMVALIFQMKKSSGEFRFLRKGKIGAFKEELTTDEIARFDEFMKHPDFEKFNFNYKF